MSDTLLLPVLKILEDQDLDAIAFVPGANFRRLFNADFHLMERPLVVIIPRDAEPVAVVPNLELLSFRSIGFPGPVFDWRDEDGYQDAFAKAAQALPMLENAERFGLEAQRMRVFEHMALSEVFPAARFVDAHNALSQMRLMKTDKEIEQLRKAIKISEIAFEKTLSSVKVGQTETEIEAILLRNLFESGADGLAFDPIVAAADNSAKPHAHARADYRIKPGDSLLFDFGARWNGYNADITRTVFVERVSDRDRAFYETVLAANAAGKAATRAGQTANQVDDEVQKVLEASEFSAFRRHKTGHGLGLDVHEAPHIMRGNPARLEAGMVFTIEPGLYREGECGVRIEDDVLVTSGGCDCLTNLPTALRVVG